MDKNLSFLLEKYSDVLNSCFELLDDITDYPALFLPRTSSKEARRLHYQSIITYPMMYHVLYPSIHYTRHALSKIIEK